MMTINNSSCSSSRGLVGVRQAVEGGEDGGLVGLMALLVEEMGTWEV